MPVVKRSEAKKDVTVSLSTGIIERLDGRRQDGESRSQQIEDLLDLAIEAHENVEREEARP